MRITTNLEHLSAWIADTHDYAPWVKFDMEQEVTVWGVIVTMVPASPERDIFLKVTSIKVSMSGDGVKWNDVSGVISTVYKGTPNISLSWFDEAATARNWKIDVVAWEYLPSMQADLLGEPKGKF